MKNNGISKQSNGTYRVQYYVKDVLSGENKKTSKRGFKTYKEAKAFKDSLSKKYTDYTFLQMFEECCIYNNNSPWTIKEQRGTMLKNMPYLETLPITSFDKQTLIEIKNRISKLDIKASSKNRLLIFLRKTLTYAENIYGIESNIKVLRKFPEVTEEKQTWTFEQFSIFEERCKVVHPKMYPLFRTLFYTGMRIGECLAIETSDLDVDNKRLYIHKSMPRGFKSLHDSTKNHHNRWVYLDDTTFEMLKQLKNEKERWMFGINKPWDQSYVHKVLCSIANECGLPKISIHSLRHSNTTLLLSNGADLLSVSKRLGHKSPTTTLNVYAHCTKKGDDELLEILNKSQNRAT